MKRQMVVSLYGRKNDFSFLKLINQSNEVTIYQEINFKENKKNSKKKTKRKCKTKRKTCSIIFTKRWIQIILCTISFASFFLVEQSIK